VHPAVLLVLLLAAAAAGLAAGPLLPSFLNLAVAQGAGRHLSFFLLGWRSADTLA